MKVASTNPSGRHPLALHGFTLIELLVVIAILAILAILGTGVYSSVMKQANSVACSTNLKQQGIILSIYAAENDGYLPSAVDNEDPYDSGQLVSWMMVLQYYMDMRFPRSGEKNILLCPAALDTYPGGVARRTYAMNVAGGSGKTRRKLSQFPQVAQTALILDSVAVGTAGDGISTFGLSDMNRTPEWRHSAAINVLFADGHVEKISESDRLAFEQYVRNYAP